jgi:hypothetical protein
MYPIFTEQLLRELKKMQWKGGYPWFSACRCFVIETLFSQWENLIVALDSRRGKVKVLVATMAGDNHARMVSNILENLMGDSANFMTYKGSLLRVNESDVVFKNADLIVSTTNISTLPQEKLFVIDGIPKDNQKEELMHIIKEKQTELHLKNLGKRMAELIRNEEADDEEDLEVEIV